LENDTPVTDPETVSLGSAFELPNVAFPGRDDEAIKGVDHTALHLGRKPPQIMQSRMGNLQFPLRRFHPSGGGTLGGGDLVKQSPPGILPRGDLSPEVRLPALLCRGTFGLGVGFVVPLGGVEGGEQRIVFCPRCFS
jgi:hypothetical protein